MSSILDALRKVEADERRHPIRLPPAQPRSRGRLAALVAAAAFVAGAGGVALIIGLRPSAPPEPVAETGTSIASAPSLDVAAPSPPAPAAPSAPAPLAPPPAAAAPAAAVPSAPPAVHAPTAAAEPAAPVAEGRVAEAPAEEVVDEPVEDAGVESDVPDQITIFRPAAQPAPETEVKVEALPTPASPEPAIDVLSGPPAGAPEIHVSFLIYSAVPERRQVSLTIDNGPLVTLHEGQKAGSVSLVRILRDRIHVEHGGRTFSVRAVL